MRQDERKRGQSDCAAEPREEYGAARPGAQDNLALPRIPIAVDRLLRMIVHARLLPPANRGARELFPRKVALALWPPESFSETVHILRDSIRTSQIECEACAFRMGSAPSFSSRDRASLRPTPRGRARRRGSQAFEFPIHSISKTFLLLDRLTFGATAAEAERLRAMGAAPGWKPSCIRRRRKSAAPGTGRDRGADVTKSQCRHSSVTSQTKRRPCVPSPI